MRRIAGVLLTLVLGACRGPSPNSVSGADAGLDAGPQLAAHDAGADAGRDAGVDAGRDAGLAPHDAGPVDAGPVDAGPLDAGPVDAGYPDSGPPFVPPSGPLLLHSQGGPVLSSAWLVTLAYPGVDNLPSLLTFADWLPGSQWLRTVGSEYGVGLAGHVHFDVPVAAPAAFQDGDVIALIEQGIDAGWWPAQVGDGGTPIWMVLYPNQSIPSALYRGEHFEWADDGGYHVGSWIAPHNDGGAPQYETYISHEVIEALTNPYYANAPAYRVAYGDYAFAQLPGGSFATGGEVGDLCQIFSAATESGYALARSWSNDASDAGLCPCVPAPADEPWQTLWGPTQPLLFTPGQSATVVLEPVSNGLATTWNVTLDPVGDPLVQAHLASATASVGVPLTLTVDVLPGALADYPAIVLNLESTLDGGTVGNTPIVVELRRP